MNLKERIGEMDRRQFAGLTVKVALVVILVPFVLVAVPQVVGASNSYIVLSNSMADHPAPVLRAGDVIFVYDTPTTSIEEGDVITFQTGEGHVTTHRVVGIQTQDGEIAFRTRGDANEEADPRPVDPELVVGTVEFSVPWVGRVVAFAGTRNGLIALVIVPSALLILSELVNIGQVLRGTEADGGLAEDSQQEKEGHQ